MGSGDPLALKELETTEIYGRSIRGLYTARLIVVVSPINQSNLSNAHFFLPARSSLPSPLIAISSTWMYHVNGYLPDIMYTRPHERTNERLRGVSLRIVSPITESKAARCDSSLSSSLLVLLLSFVVVCLPLLLLLLLQRSSPFIKIVYRCACLPIYTPPSFRPFVCLAYCYLLARLHILYSDVPPAPRTVWPTWKSERILSPAARKTHFFPSPMTPQSLNNFSRYQ